MYPYTLSCQCNGGRVGKNSVRVLYTNHPTFFMKAGKIVGVHSFLPIIRGPMSLILSIPALEAVLLKLDKNTSEARSRVGTHLNKLSENWAKNRSFFYETTVFHIFSAWCHAYLIVRIHSCCRYWRGSLLAEFWNAIWTSGMVKPYSRQTWDRERRTKLKCIPANMYLDSSLEMRLESIYVAMVKPILIWNYMSYFKLH